ncbi:MAG: hypothetical protein WDO18_00520 [Acidobacteriota bacterium]
MKLEHGGTGKKGERLTTGSRVLTGAARGPLSVEWMDPMSWRLPSGKSLAAFALQSGFLAPLLLNGPLGNGRVKKRPAAGKVSGVPAGEEPVSSGRFRLRNGTGGLGEDGTIGQGR